MSPVVIKYFFVLYEYPEYFCCAQWSKSEQKSSWPKVKMIRLNQNESVNDKNGKKYSEFLSWFLIQSFLF